ncbi:MAG: NAD+ synthase [bacterium]|nr:NAD+ synthase [bacterium]
MRIALLQLNLLVGDIEGNAERILKAVRTITEPVDLIITSELALVGYPAKDLLFNYALIDRCRLQLERLAQDLNGGPAMLVGAPELNLSGMGKPLFNSTFLLHEGLIKASFQKKLLPNYDVFDEARYFESSKESQIMELAGKMVGITICEDIWNDHLFKASPLYATNPLSDLRAQGVEVVVNLSSSPFSLGKNKQKEAMLQSIAKKSKVPLVYVNQVGGNDDLIFDGRSMAYDGQGNKLAQGRLFEEDVIIVDLYDPQGVVEPEYDEDAEIFGALVTGTRDYIHKCGFKKACLGLSGGIDSALVAVIAAHALGPENVTALMMPSRHSSQGSLDDSKELAQRLGVVAKEVPIGPLMSSFDASLKGLFGAEPQGLTAENLQARIRGNLLMALSNEENSLLLSTGNKSELSVGYCTIYGDMAGALAVISDLPKSRVYRMARWINAHHGNPIPEEILTKAPSAELRPDQKDQDSLPDYDTLDAILLRFIEQRLSGQEIIDEGFDAEMVWDIIRKVRGAEFKRKQSPPGLKIHELAFGTGWRMPLAAKTL